MTEVVINKITYICLDVRDMVRYIEDLGYKINFKENNFFSIFFTYSMNKIWTIYFGIIRKNVYKIRDFIIKIIIF